jgi:2-oxoglutarate ferredoxin oxidoreductase subunit delta
MTTAVGTVTINTAQCKGCDLCIPVCPPQVLVMTTHEVNETGYRYPLLLDGCTGCGRCHAVCPDFVFTVFQEQTT